MKEYYDIRTFDEDTKLFTKLSKERLKCEHCGHSIHLEKQDRTICTWCNRWVYRNDKAKFKYKLLEARERSKNNGR